jgi:hypothetical protein
MLRAEAQWFARRIRRLSAAAFPMLNVGSQTAAFRTRVQPWIDGYLFRQPMAAGHTVVHTDLQVGDGVDLVGDLMDPEFVARLRQQAFRSILCCNLLEHVEDPAIVAVALTSIVHTGGYLFVSVPHVFPYHPDPIDTMYRPTPTEVASLFPRTNLVEGEIVRGGTLLSYAIARLLSAPLQLLTDVARPRHGAAENESARHGSMLRMLPSLVQRLRVSCVVLQKAGE